MLECWGDVLDPLPPTWPHGTMLAVGIQMDIFELYGYFGAGGCQHDLLVRAARPDYVNADQGMDDAANAFSTWMIAHLRRWWETYRLPRDCRADHTAALLGETGMWVGDDLEGIGLRYVEILTAWPVEGGVAMALGTVADEQEFRTELAEGYFDAVAPEDWQPATRRRAYLMTDLDGRGDLQDS